MDPSTVLGVAVPSPLKTAKNHGVFVMPMTQQQQDDSRHGKNKTIYIDDPIDVWQKPSIEQFCQGNNITTSNSTTVSASFEVSNRIGKQAWIDVGIVIFYPKAFQTLIDLSNNLLSKCTRRGLEDAYNNNDENEDELMSLEEYGKQYALKVDLYTDILHNLPWTNKAVLETTKADGSDGDLKSALRQILSTLTLRVLIVPDGSFLHLGTTTELVEFITYGSCRHHHNSNQQLQQQQEEDDGEQTTTKAIDRDIAQSLAKTLKLSPRFNTLNGPTIDPLYPNVTLRSTFPPNNNCTIGKSTLVEYSDLDMYESVSIGTDCMLSGWRIPSPPTTADKEGPTTFDHFHVPDTLSIQLLALQQDDEGSGSANKKEINGNAQYVLMVLGTDDPIKSPIRHSTLYDVPVHQFLDFTGIVFSDLGLKYNPDESDCLWTAKIHPVVRSHEVALSFPSYFGWLEQLRGGNSDLTNDPSFLRWLHAKRVSLKDLHGISDAGKEWAFRNVLDAKIWRRQSESEITKVRHLLLERSQDHPCDLTWLMEMEDQELAYEALVKFVDAMEEISAAALKRKEYDISGRALMLASATLADFANVDSRFDNTAPDDTSDEVMSECNILLQRLKQSSTQSLPPEEISRVFQSILQLRKWFMSNAGSSSLIVCSEILERVALRMTEFTISEGFRSFLDPTKKVDTIKIERSHEPIHDNWVISVSPVRVDLAGGWSDTPPICYEFGGSVTGMAVLVNNRYPLCCRCRTVSEGSGILVRSEIRDISSGSLISSTQEEITSITQMNGFRDPSGVCSLLKASLVCLGMVTEHQIEQEFELQSLINTFCSSSQNVRLEIATTSLLGLGTGMGTSSILGACILQSIAECVGIGMFITEDEFLLHAVLMVEQLLSSGGGWQDQAHGIFPGVKTVTTQPPTIPMQIKVESLMIPKESMVAFEKRLIFAYTGQTRLAKNILQQVLRRWSRRTPEIVHTVESLVKCSESVRKAYLDEDWDLIAETMYQSFQLKCVMAGSDSGAEPKEVRVFISELLQAQLIKGAMLCGAGGGGFLLLVTSNESIDRKEIESFFQNNILHTNKNYEDFCFYSCNIATKGLTTRILNSTLDAESFDMSWQSSDVNE